VLTIRKRLAYSIGMKEELRRYMASIGSKGGAAGRGEAKARTSDQARAAVMKRWEQHRSKTTGAKQRKPKNGGKK